MLQAAWDVLFGNSLPEPPRSLSRMAYEEARSRNHPQSPATLGYVHYDTNSTRLPEAYYTISNGYAEAEESIEDRVIVERILHEFSAPTCVAGEILHLRLPAYRTGKRYNQHAIQKKVVLDDA